MKGFGIILLVGSVVATLLLVVSFFPVSYERVVREGTDKFEAHHALWGERVKSLTTTADSPVYSVGFVLVNLRRATTLSDAHVRIIVDGKGEVASGNVSVKLDDGFTWFRVPAGAIDAGNQYTVEVSAPSAPQEAPVGIRFDSESKQLAFALREKVSIYEYVLRWSGDNPDASRRVFRTLIGGIGLAVILFSVDLLLTSSLRSQSYGRQAPMYSLIWVVSLCILFACAVYIRIPLASSLDSAYGGDAFNYLLKSRALIDGEDPFAADPRKAPLYSLLVAPGLATPFDAVAWERWVSMFAAAGCVVLVSLFLRKFGMPHAIALAGGALLAVNRDFQFESVQGLSNTLYAFLVFLSAYTFLIARPYLVAVFSALATLTRYEGAAVVALLAPASWFLYSPKWRNILQTIIPLIILLSIPFLMSPFSQTLGVRTISDIQGDEGLYVAYSFEDFSSNFKSFKNFFGRLWILTEHIGKPFVWMVFGICLGVFGVLLRLTSPSLSFVGSGERRRIPLLTKEGLGAVSNLIPYALVIFIFAVLIRNSSQEHAYLVQLFSLLAGIGISAALVQNTKRTTPIILMILVQIIAITAILPKTRYYLPVIPFIAIAIIGGAYALTLGKHSRTKVFGSLLLISCITSFVYVDAQEALSGQVSDYNEKSAGQTVLLSAARYMKHASGSVAAVEESDLQFRTYLSRDRLVTFPDSLRNTDDQYAKLKESGAAFMSETTGNPYFAKLIAEKPDAFQEVATFKTRWADTFATLYRVY
ncbi:MAG: hypothetical protein O3A36_02725 [bacterium]|nr:hypothetical protein [bacterium]